MLQYDFQEMIWEYARLHNRRMPWRDNTDPYYILVSELMLQQTQVDRVIPKFHAFIAGFPSTKALASVPLSRVLGLWSGLGYNRRAKFLWQAAKKIEKDFNGVIPETYDELVSLPGVGPGTAGAIMAYAFNQPIVFIETNIRTVFFHHFFNDREKVTDKELRQKVEEMLDYENPREWYWALMDYGTSLKKQGLGRLDISAHYKKQSTLKGSMREMRGLIIKALHEEPMGEEKLKHIVKGDKRFLPALKALIKEEMIIKTADDLYALA